MNKEDAHLYLPLVEALADGKTIQQRVSFESWEDFKQDCEIMFNRPPEHYRIKPEPPRTFEMWLGPTGTMYPVNLYPNPIDCERITVREVLE